MVYIKKFKRNRPQNLRGVMRPRGHSFLEESLGHPRISRTLMRALVGNRMDMTPFDLVHMERLRAASRTTRRRTQQLYEEEDLQDMAQRERDAVATTESDSDASVFSWEWGQYSPIRNATESDGTQSDATEIDSTESDSDESFGPGWVWNQRARALGDLTNDQQYYRDDLASRWYG